MTKPQKITLYASIAISIGIITGATIVSNNRKAGQVAVASVAHHPVTAAQLARADGKNGRNCYVAIDGTVYLIKDFSLWQDGKHVSSKGLAYCGADLSKVIDQAPHGRKILDLLPRVGPLVN